MFICLFEDDGVAHLSPLVDTRAVYDVRVGIRTIRERLVEMLGEPRVLLHARSLLAETVSQESGEVVNHIPEGLDVLFVNGRLLAPGTEIIGRLKQLLGSTESARLLTSGEVVVAAWVPQASTTLVNTDYLNRASFEGLPEEDIGDVPLLGRMWHTLDHLVDAIRSDFEARTTRYNIFERPGADIQDGALLRNGEHIHVGANARIRPGAILNADEGPIFVDEGATIMEQAVIRGPVYVGAAAEIKIGARIARCAIGPRCKVGGEVHDTILQSFANKAHDGFLGHAYIGRWCNLGAATNNSNLRNDYGPVRLRNPVTGENETTGRQFVGLFMGDHSKTGINTMFNTGTIVGVGCNVWGAGYQRQYIPSFTWGSPDDRYVTYRLEKALHVAEKVMLRRGKELTAVDRDVLRAIFEASADDRAGML